MEDVRTVTRTYELVTKLTGAGGGGCAVTLVPEGEAIFVVPSVL